MAFTVSVDRGLPENIGPTGCCCINGCVACCSRLQGASHSSVINCSSNPRSFSHSSFFSRSLTSNSVCLAVLLSVYSLLVMLVGSLAVASFALTLVACAISGTFLHSTSHFVRVLACVLACVCILKLLLAGGRQRPFFAAGVLVGLSVLLVWLSVELIVRLLFGLSVRQPPLSAAGVLVRLLVLSVELSVELSVGLLLRLSVGLQLSVAVQILCVLPFSTTGSGRTLSAAGV